MGIANTMQLERARAARRSQRALAAYTAEDYESDVRAGWIAPTKIECPAGPAEKCPGHPNPLYRFTWERRAWVTKVVYQNGKRITHRRRRRVVSTVCYDHRLEIEWRDRQRFYAEFGDHGLGEIRPPAAEIDCHEARAMHILIRRKRICDMAGPPLVELTDDETCDLYATVLRLLGSYTKARSNLRG